MLTSIILPPENLSMLYHQFSTSIQSTLEKLSIFIIKFFAINTNAHQEAIHLSSEFQRIINDREFESLFRVGNLLMFQNVSVRKITETKNKKHLIHFLKHNGHCGKFLKTKHHSHK